MLRVFVGLKLTILRNSFAKDARSRVGLIVLAVTGVGAGSLGAWSFIQDSRRGELSWSRSLAPGFAVILLAWVLGPLLMGGVDDMVDPDRLALLPLTRREMRDGLLAASLVGFVPLGTLLALSGVVIGHADAGLSGLLVVLACGAHFAFAVVAGRAVAVLLARGARSRRGRDASVVLASMAAGTVWLATQSITVISDSAYDVVVRVIGWTPAGSLGQAVIDARSGRSLSASLRIAASLLLSAALAHVWMAGLERATVEPVLTDARRGRRHRSDRGLMDGWPAGAATRPWAVVLRKELRYLARSPQRRSALIVGTVIGAPFALLQAFRIGGTSTASIYLAPTALIFGMGASNNILGADSPSLWLETTSGTTLRALLLGRSIATAPFVVTPVVSASLLIAAVSGGWTGFAETTVLALVCCGVPIGVGALVSVIAPLPQPDTANPYSHRRSSAGEGCLVGLMAIVSLFAVVLLLTPVMLAVLRWHGRPAPVFAAVVPAAAAYSAAVWFGCVRLAARYATPRLPELLHDLGRRRVTS
jgi:ABC-2 type transport system permease protein